MDCLRAQWNPAWPPKILFIVLFSTLLLCKPLVEHSFAAGRAETTGDVLRLLLPATAYGATFFNDDQDGRKQFYLSILTSVATTQLLKAAIDKKRPDGSDYNSFPSAHSADAFQAATFVHKRYGWQYGLPLYLGASFVGYSRIQADRHDLTDVLTGAAIGAASNFFTTGHDTTLIATLVSPQFFGIRVSSAW